MMTIPGLFYGGLSQPSKVLATAMHSFSITCLITVLWLIQLQPALTRK
jgi:Amt family ammonium transporter